MNASDANDPPRNNKSLDCELTVDGTRRSGSATIDRDRKQKHG
jgi:hypothetical protein